MKHKDVGNISKVDGEMNKEANVLWMGKRHFHDYKQSFRYHQ